MNTNDREELLFWARNTGRRAKQLGKGASTSLIRRDILLGSLRLACLLLPNIPPLAHPVHRIASRLVSDSSTNMLICQNTKQAMSSLSMLRTYYNIAEYAGRYRDQAWSINKFLDIDCKQLENTLSEEKHLYLIRSTDLFVCMLRGIYFPPRDLAAYMLRRNTVAESHLTRRAMNRIQTQTTRYIELIQTVLCSPYAPPMPHGGTPDWCKLDLTKAYRNYMGYALATANMTKNEFAYYRVRILAPVIFRRLIIMLYICDPARISPFIGISGQLGTAFLHILLKRFHFTALEVIISEVDSDFDQCEPVANVRDYESWSIVEELYNVAFRIVEGCAMGKEEQFAVALLRFRTIVRKWEWLSGRKENRVGGSCPLTRTRRPES